MPTTAMMAAMIHKTVVLMTSPLYEFDGPLGGDD